MFIAAMTDSPGLEGMISQTFAQAKYLLIIEAEGASVCATYARSSVGGDRDLARRIVEHDCEAVLCGPLEEEPFEIIADEGCVTRYLACGLSAAEALKEMEAYRLDMIPDFIGGTGCHSGEEARCCGEHESHMTI